MDLNIDGPHGGDAQTAARSLAGHLTEAAALADRGRQDERARRETADINRRLGRARWGRAEKAARGRSQDKPERGNGLVRPLLGADQRDAGHHPPGRPPGCPRPDEGPDHEIWFTKNPMTPPSSKLTVLEMYVVRCRSQCEGRCAR